MFQFKNKENHLNYLAHISLGHLSNTSPLGNFLGDFVKGSDLTDLPEHISHGVTLHRKIDTFTDSHTYIRELKQTFPASLRRMSGVVIDIYFDHVLCSQWDKYHTSNMTKVLDTFYQELETTNVSLKGRFNDVRKNLLEHRWLNNYASKSQCYNAFYHIEKRLKHKVIFAELATEHLRDNSKTLEATFDAFFPLLVDYTKKISTQKIQYNDCPQ